jgi:hypothetical protein
LYGSEYFLKPLFKCPFVEFYRKPLLMVGKPKWPRFIDGLKIRSYVAFCSEMMLVKMAVAYRVKYFICQPETLCSGGYSDL